MLVIKADGADCLAIDPACPVHVREAAGVSDHPTDANAAFGMAQAIEHALADMRLHGGAVGWASQSNLYTALRDYRMACPDSHGKAFMYAGETYAQRVKGGEFTKQDEGKPEPDLWDRVLDAYHEGGKAAVAAMKPSRAAQVDEPEGERWPRPQSAPLDPALRGWVGYRDDGQHTWALQIPHGQIGGWSDEMLDREFDILRAEAKNYVREWRALNQRSAKT